MQPGRWVRFGQRRRVSSKWTKESAPLLLSVLAETYSGRLAKGWHDWISISVNNSWESSTQSKIQSFPCLHGGCFQKNKISMH